MSRLASFAKSRATIQGSGFLVMEDAARSPVKIAYIDPDEVTRTTAEAAGTVASEMNRAGFRLEIVMPEHKRPGFYVEWWTTRPGA